MKLEVIIKKILIFLPLIFLAYTPWTLYPAIFGRTIIFQIVIEFILAALLIAAIAKSSVGRDLFSRMRNIFRTPLGLTLIVFTGTELFSLFHSIDREASFWGSMSRMDGVFTWLHMAALFFLLLLFFTSRQEWIVAFKIHIVVASFLSIIAVVQHFHDVIPRYIPQSGRVYATFGNPVFFAPYLLFALFFTAVVFEEILKKKQEITRMHYIRSLVFLGGALLIELAALILTDSKASIGGLLLGIFVIIFAIIWRSNRFLAHGKKIKILLSLGICVMLALSFLRVSHVKIGRDLHFSSFESLRTRLLTWRLGVEAWKEHPLLGFGPATFSYIFDSHYDPHLLKYSFYETVSNKPHNIIIEMLDHGGIIGLGSYALIFIVAFDSLWKNKKAGRFVFGATALLIGYLFSLQFGFDSTNSWIMLMVFLAFLAFETQNSTAVAGAGALDQLCNKISKPLSKKYRLAAELGALLVLGFFVLINAEAWRASVPATRSEVSYWLQKPIRWADTVVQAVRLPTPYPDDIRTILTQDLMIWEGQGDLPFADVRDQIGVLLQKLELGVHERPRNFQALVLLGQVQGLWAENFDQKYFDRAEQTLRRALALSPRNQSAYLVLGKVLMIKGDLKKAEEIISQAAQVYEDAADPHWFLGLAYSAEGNYMDAVKEFQRAMDLGYNFKPQELGYWIGINNQLGKTEQNPALEKRLIEKVHEIETQGITVSR